MTDNDAQGAVLVVTASHAVLPGIRGLGPATLVIDKSAGKILRVLNRVISGSDSTSREDDHVIAGYRQSGAEFVRLEDGQVLLPGLVDAHVHINAPGREAWEGFETGTRAAASGGITTIVDMPLNSIPSTTTVANLEAKTKAASGNCHIDVAFWGGVVPGNQDDLLPLIEAGVKGFKCFLCDSGVEEFPMVQESDLVLAMEKLKDTESLLLFHAELGDRLDESHKDPRHYSTFLDSSPEQLEVDAIALVSRLSSRYPHLRTHIVHLSAASALSILQDARKAKKLPMTVETCIHYLTLEAEGVPDGRTDYKCCPPIRDSKNRELLWRALQDGSIDFVVSDHSPCVAELKKLPQGDFLEAWGGIGGLGLGLSLMYTEGRRRGVGLDQLMLWLASRPAEQVGLGKTKGSLQEGFDADFCIFDTTKPFTLQSQDLIFKNKVSPYTGMQVAGRVDKTYLRGKKVFDASAAEQFLRTPAGQLLL